jgi:hypothetical protein
LAGNSITLVLGAAGEEARVLSSLDRAPEPRPLPETIEDLPSRDEAEAMEAIEWATTFPTLQAATWVTEVLSAPPAEAVDRIQRLGRRATRDYLKVTDVLSKDELDTAVRTPAQRTAEVPSARLFATAQSLRQTEQRTQTELTVRGALYQADAKNHKFRLITDEGRSITGDYLPERQAMVRDGWAKVVRVQITRSDYLWVHADRPHRTTYRLEEILRIYEDADEFLTEIQE